MWHLDLENIEDHSMSVNGREGLLMMSMLIWGQWLMIAVLC